MFEAIILALKKEPLAVLSWLGGCVIIVYQRIKSVPRLHLYPHSILSGATENLMIEVTYEKGTKPVYLSNSYIAVAFRDEGISTFSVEEPFWILSPEKRAVQIDLGINPFPGDWIDDVRIRDFNGRLYSLRRSMLWHRLNMWRFVVRLKTEHLQEKVLPKILR